MTEIKIVVRAVAAAAVIVMTGCADPPDKRLADLAQQSLNQQSHQSEQLAKQSEQVAATAHELVAADARSRQDLIASLAKLQEQIQAQHAVFDRQRDELERERRELAAQRGRDPIIAQAIGALGVTLACLLPLVLAGYVLYTVNHTSPPADADAVSEVLIGEIVSATPELLSGPGAAGQLEGKSLMHSGPPAPPAGELPF